MTDAAHRGVNRRLTSRTACRVGVRYRVGGAWHPATAMDLSPHGCRLRLGEDLDRGSEVTVVLEHPGKDVEMIRAEVQGQVIWSRREGLSHQAGIQFSSGAAAAALAAIIESVR